jgi:ATP-dependent Clp protease adaptor protein ClpS
MEPFDAAPERDEGLAPTARRKSKRPRRFQVIFHNDDYTSMEFVVHLLTTHFRKAPAEAVQVMLEVHHKGAGVAGIYPREIAETKVASATDEARANGMPLLITTEPYEGSAR